MSDGTFGAVVGFGALLWFVIMILLLSQGSKREGLLKQRIASGEELATALDKQVAAQKELIDALKRQIAAQDDALDSQKKLIEAQRRLLVRAGIIPDAMAQELAEANGERAKP